MDKKVDKKVDKLLDEVKEVIHAQKELAKKQEVILNEVTEDTKEEQAVEKKVESIEGINSSFIVRTKNHQFLFPLIITAAVVLIWRGLSGIYDATPFVNYSVISLILGIGILWIFSRKKSK